MRFLVDRLPAPDMPDTGPRSRRHVWDACWRGEEPAEALALIAPWLVEELFYRLWLLGWTDTELAQHTKHTTYTVARIRARLGLAANHHHAKGAAA